MQASHAPAASGSGCGLCLLALAARLRRADAGAARTHFAPRGASASGAQGVPAAAPQTAAVAAAAIPAPVPPPAAAAAAPAAATPAVASATKPSVGDVLVLRCDRLGSNARGICIAPGGMVVMVPRALPGELLEVKITSVKGSYAEGARTRTLEPHADAVPPPCRHHSACGGCPLQALDYGAQLKEKRRAAAELLARVGRVEDAARLVAPAVGAPEGRRLRYRNKAQFAFSWNVLREPPGAASGGAAPGMALAAADQTDHCSQWGLGFYPPGTNGVVLPISECLLQGPAANRALTAAREAAVKLGLEPHDAPSGRGVLRHLIIRSADRRHGGTRGDGDGGAFDDAEASAGAAAAQGSSGGVPTVDATVGTAAAAEAAVAACASVGLGSSEGQQLPGSCKKQLSDNEEIELQVVLVTTECPSSPLRPWADLVKAAVPEVVSVVHSVEGAGGGGPAVPARRAKAKQQRKPSRGRGRAASGRGDADEGNGDGGGRRGARALAVARSTTLLGRAALEQHLCGLSFAVGPHSFFQTNAFMAQVLYDLVAEAAGQVPPFSPVLDLYTGTGTIALSLAKRLGPKARVWGADISAEAIEDARRNAAANGIRGAEFVHGDLDQLLAPRGAAAGGRRPGGGGSRGTEGRELLEAGGLLGAAAAAGGRWTGAVVVDPARAGLGESVVEFLRRLGAPRVVYVSCNPATQARDVARLSGSYRVASVTPVDMFPQTEHVETVTVLERVEA